MSYFRNMCFVILGFSKIGLTSHNMSPLAFFCPFIFFHSGCQADFIPPSKLRLVLRNFYFGRL